MTEETKKAKVTRGIPFAKGNPGKPKGAVSKISRTAKETIEEVANHLGGAQRIIKWVNDDPQNERIFWGSIYPKLLPLQVAGDSASPLVVEIVRFSQSGQE